MGKLFEIITQEMQQWIERQKMFFVATAPLSETGHVNCSPKGLDTFRVIGPNTVIYQDLTGSGAETIAHVRENKRIVIMFCAFEGPPKIVRLHGTGEVITQEHPDYDTLAAQFPPRIGFRAYIRITATRISDSCGYSVPLYEFKQERDVLDKYNMNKGEDGLQQYRALKNRESIDGLKALD